MTTPVHTSKAPPRYDLVRSEHDTALLLFGSWTLLESEQIVAPDCTPKGGEHLVVDGSKLAALDTAGAMRVLAVARSLGAKSDSISFRGFAPSFLSIAQLVQARADGTLEKPRPASLTLVEDIGKASIRVWTLFSQFINSLGELVTESMALIARPSLLRPRELFVQLERSCIYALPIVALVTFLIGVVVAYLSAMQLERYGASIFLVDGVGITMCRELSPVLVAIIMAGRSGSAFTAQIGAMKINEEIDAIRVLGLSPFQVLVLPRVLALLICMPLLTLVGDIVGIAGGLLIGKEYLGITPSTFIDRLQLVVPVRHVLLGLAKAPVFGLVIALIGCRMGLEVENNATSVGNNTTSTVVQCIVSVILLDAAFALLFSEMNL